MVKVVVLENFSLGRYDELKNIVRANKDKKGNLFVGDTFECTKEMAKYLTNEEPNPQNRAFVKVIATIPAKRGRPAKKTLTENENNDINK